MKIKSLLPYITLIFLTLLAHFLPFERLSPTTDEYEILAKLQTSSLKDICISSLHYPDRPVMNIYFSTIEWIVNQHQLLSVTLLFLISSLFALFVYFFMLKLLSNKPLALLGATFHLLLPNKLQIFDGLDYTNIFIVYSLSLVSFLFFISFLKSKKKRFLWTSFLIYTLVIFWYAQPFFLPVILACYAFFYNKEKIKSMSTTLLFWIPAFIYIILQGPIRYLLKLGRPTYAVQDTDTLIHNIMVEIPNVYMGRYMIRDILYGLYRFPSIELQWLWIIIVLDILAFYIFIKWLKKISDFKIDPKLIVLSLIMFIAFLLPSCFWVVQGRHTVLASIGLIFMGLFFFRFQMMQAHKVKILASIFVLFLIVCQGTAWNQVVMCRINNALYQYFLKNKDEILKADRIVFHQYSFAKNIPYGWAPFLEPNGITDDHLDTFWGGRGFHGIIGFPSMVEVALGKKIPVFVARSEINVDHELRLMDRDKIHITLPKQGTVIVDYDKVNAYHSLRE